MECDHKLAGNAADLLTFCSRCGHWFEVCIDAEGYKAWKPYDREPVPGLVV